MFTLLNRPMREANKEPVKEITRPQRDRQEGGTFQPVVLLSSLLAQSSSHSANRLQAATQHNCMYAIGMIGILEFWPQSLMGLSTAAAARAEVKTHAHDDLDAVFASSSSFTNPSSSRSITAADPFDLFGGLGTTQNTAAKAVNKAEPYGLDAMLAETGKSASCYLDLTNTALRCKMPTKGEENRKFFPATISDHQICSADAAV